MKKGKFTKPIGYIEHIGDYIIKKVANYGKKYIVYKGQCFWRFATIQQAREFSAKHLYQSTKAL